MKKVTINSNAVEAVIIKDKRKTDAFIWCKKPIIYSFFDTIMFWKVRNIKEEYAFKGRYEYITKENFLKGVFTECWKHTSDYIIDNENNVYLKPEVQIDYMSGDKVTTKFDSIEQANLYAKPFLGAITNKIEL